MEKTKRPIKVRFDVRTRAWQWRCRERHMDAPIAVIGVEQFLTPGLAADRGLEHWREQHRYDDDHRRGHHRGQSIRTGP